MALLLAIVLLLMFGLVLVLGLLRVVQDLVQGPVQDAPVFRDQETAVRESGAGPRRARS